MSSGLSNASFVYIEFIVVYNSYILLHRINSMLVIYSMTGMRGVGSPIVIKVHALNTSVSRFICTLDVPVCVKFHAYLIDVCTYVFVCVCIVCVCVSCAYDARAAKYRLRA
jgi:hypothetical protein